MNRRDFLRISAIGAAAGSLVGPAAASLSGDSVIYEGLFDPDGKIYPRQRSADSLMFSLRRAELEAEIIRDTEDPTDLLRHWCRYNKHVMAAFDDLDRRQRAAYVDGFCRWLRDVEAVALRNIGAAWS